MRLQPDNGLLIQASPIDLGSFLERSVDLVGDSLDGEADHWHLGVVAKWNRCDSILADVRTIPMFSATADLYDLVYSSFKNYVAEADQIAALIRTARPSTGQDASTAPTTILDVGCGTGEHARLLGERHGFRVDGIDLDPNFVRIARGKNVMGAFSEADMTAFDLGRRYDVVMCLFSSIGYVRTLDNLLRTFESFRRHLAPGGAILVEPWFTPEALAPGPTRHMVVQRDNPTIVRMSHIACEGRLSRLRFEYLVGRPDGITHLAELHEMGLFTVEETLECFRAAGLHATHDPNGLIGRGMYVAREGG